MRILVTGANGFIGHNLITHLREYDDAEVVTFSRENSLEELLELVKHVDVVVHLAGINRPENDSEFVVGNHKLTDFLCQVLTSTGRKVPIIFTSSIHAELDNPYGSSKYAAEEVIKRYSKETGSKVYIYRLTNVFGKWCRPNYNSVIATFCYNIANDLPIQINDPNTELDLVYIDDVVKEFISVLFTPHKSSVPDVFPLYSIKLGELAEQLKCFHDSRKTLMVGEIGRGLTRALYATYLSYLRPEFFSYRLLKHEDKRGVFAEVLKTDSSGQLSFFTAHPGVTRGGHYHHTKNEKFLVISGLAEFGFRHIVTGEKYTVEVSGCLPEVVETVPGWMHSITNIGDSEMVVMLWANEIYDENNPDTYIDENG